ncbi:MAG: replication initiation factor domain-containing protein [Colwellia sp.]|nr:replication initiation factor domain-containing protein [Colwellia sp.]
MNSKLPPIEGYKQPSPTTSIPCKVDALSLTWSPQELLRIKHLAKIGATVKDEFRTKARQLAQKRKFAALDSARNTMSESLYLSACQEITREFDERRHKDLTSTSRHLSDCEMAARFELRDIFDGELIVDTAAKYGDRLSNLLENIGIDLLDVLCCGEAERFVCRLNHVFTKDEYMWTVKPNPAGRFNYQYSANLYADGQHAGLIAWGGKNCGCYVSFMGQGCDALDMARLYEEIKNIPEIKITRIDLAHDDFAGTRSINVARKYAKRGGFCSGGRPASYMYIESGHLNKKVSAELKKQYKFVPDKGRSLYVGSRESGKLLRVYEKGIQLGDPKSKWVRWELELHSSQRIIPLDTMIKPSEYLAGAYPALSFLNEEQNKIKTMVKQAKITVQHIIENQVTSTRKALNMMRVILGMTDSEIMTRFLKDLEDPLSASAMPKRLQYTATEEYFLQNLTT